MNKSIKAEPRTKWKGKETRRLKAVLKPKLNQETEIEKHARGSTSIEASYQMKFEATKQKLHDSYIKIENGRLDFFHSLSPSLFFLLSF